MRKPNYDTIPWAVLLCGIGGALVVVYLMFTHCEP